MTIPVIIGIILPAHGEVPKRLKGLVSKTSRRESVRGFEPLLLRQKNEKALQILE